MRTCIGLTSGLTCAVIIGGLALAQQERRQEKSSSRTEVRSEQRSRSTTEVRRVSAVVGGTVRLASGTSIGKIEDIVISDQGCIDYVVVVYHDRFVPIPWSVATVQFNDRVVVIDIDEERFKQIPTFTKNEFHVLADVEFTKKVNKTFNVESTRRESRTREGERRRGDSEADRKGDNRPAPRGKDADAKKDDTKKEDTKARDSDKKDRPKEKDSDKKDKAKEKDSDKKDKPKDKDKDKDSEKKDKP
jgi:hypothetical protein